VNGYWTEGALIKRYRSLAPSPARPIDKELSTPPRLLPFTVCYCRRFILIVKPHHSWYVI